MQALQELLTAIVEKNDRAQSLQDEIVAAKTEQEKSALQNELGQELEDIQQRRESFLKLLTGLSLQEYEEQEPEEVSLLDELEALFKPLLSSLNDFTSRSRTIERLKLKIAAKEQLAEKIIAGIARAEHLQSLGQDEKLKSAIGVAVQALQERVQELEQERLVASEELKDLQRSRHGILGSLRNLLGNFLTQNLRNLFFMLLAAGATYFSLRVLYGRLVRTNTCQRLMERVHALRIVNIVLRLLIVVFALLVGLFVLYLTNDWILIGLFILLILGFVWSIKDDIPAHIRQLQTLLNLGSVREGERILMAGLPWRVGPINYFTALENPALAGGKLRINLAELTELTSRPFSKNEPWFPTRKNDWVLLSDGTYGKVILQTPEQTALQVYGSSTKTYPTTSFLGLAPINLSHGFGIYFLFGVDYAHQTVATQEIPFLLKQAIQSGFSSAGIGENLSALTVEFAQAGASSLDIAVFALFSPQAADSYFMMRRMLNRLAVEACTAHGWSIPFTQVTIHAAEETKDVEEHSDS